MSKNSLLDRSIDALFSIKKETLFLVGVILVGFLIRLIVAINLPISADDMVHALHAINFYASNKLIDYSQSAGLWHLFTDIMYKIFGVNQLSSRMAALIFGTLTIGSMYLLTSQFFDKKTSIFAALLTATAPFHILNTTPEMDVFVMFFVITGSYLFIEATKKEFLWRYALAGTFFGLALYAKVYSLLFIPSALIYFVYHTHHEKKKLFSKRSILKMGIFLAVAGLFAIPTLAHNYLLYQDKGFVDLQFTSSLGLGKNVSQQYFGWDGHFNSKYDWKPLIFGNSPHSEGWSTLPTLLLTPSFILYGSPIVFILGLLSLVYLLFVNRRESSYPIFFVCFVSIILVYLSGIFLLSKHYLFLELFLIPLAARSLSLFESKLSQFTSKRNIMIVFALILILFALIFLGYKYQIFGESASGQAISLVSKDLPKQALYVGDSRIYRGQLIWMLNGHASLETAQFISLLDQDKSDTSQKVPIDMYYIECVTEDCGWGTIASQPELNATMEAFTSYFANNSQLVATISQPKPAKPYFPPFIGSKEITFRIYKTTISVNPQIVTLALQPKNWFLYYVGYPLPSQEFDYYDVHTIIGSLLNLIAHAISRIALVLCFASAGCCLYLLFRNL